MDGEAINRALRRIAHEIIERNGDLSALVLAGILILYREPFRLGDYQPGLSPQFVRGTFVPGWKTVADPKLLGKAIRVFKWVVPLRE